MKLKRESEMYKPQSFPKHTLDENGHEVLDNTPVEIPVQFRRPETLAEQVARLVKANQVNTPGVEEFDDFEDFDDFGEDPADFATPWETVFDERTGKEVYKAEKAFLDNIMTEAKRRTEALRKAKAEANRDDSPRTPRETRSPRPKKDKSRQLDIEDED